MFVSPAPMPRIEADTPGPKAPCVRRNSALGTTAVRSATDSRPRSSSASAVTAVMAIGVSCMLVDWRVAVTTMSAIPWAGSAAVPAPAASCAMTGVAAVAATARARMDTGACFSFLICSLPILEFESHRTRTAASGSRWWTSCQSKKSGRVAPHEAAYLVVVESELDAEADHRAETADRRGVVDLAQVRSQNRLLDSARLDDVAQLVARIVVEARLGDEHAQRMLDERPALAQLANVCVSGADGVGRMLHQAPAHPPHFRFLEQRPNFRNMQVPRREHRVELGDLVEDFLDLVLDTPVVIDNRQHLGALHRLLGRQQAPVSIVADVVGG